MAPDPRALADRVARTYRDYLALGHATERSPLGRVVRSEASPRIFDANHLQAVSAASPDEVEEVLAFAGRALADRPCRHVLTDPTSAPALTARLAWLGYRGSATIQSVLPADRELVGPAPFAAEVRPVVDEADWASLGSLMVEEHASREDPKARMDAAISAEMLATKRAKAPAVRFFLARAEGEDAAYVSSWPGRDGLGMLEDLATRPRFRRRGLARALVHHAVADARDRGASDVLIGADPEDWPRRLYASLGFVPAALTWSWLLRSEQAEPPAA